MELYLFFMLIYLFFLFLVSSVQISLNYLPVSKWMFDLNGCMCWGHCPLTRAISTKTKSIQVMNHAEKNVGKIWVGWIVNIGVSWSLTS